MILALICVVVVLYGIGITGALVWIMSVEQDLDALRDEVYERLP